MPLRSVDPVGDFDDVLALLQACDRDVYGATDWTAQELREQWDEIDLASDAWVAVDGAAVVGVMHLCERRGDTFIGDGYVAPHARGRRIGASLVHALEARVHEVLAQSPASGRPLVHLAHLVGDETAPALFAQEGFERARSFFRMVIELEERLLAPVWPDGVELRPFDPARDGPALHETDVLAFRDEWGYRVQPYEAWYERLFVTPRVDPALPVVAWAGEVVAGMALNYPKRMGDWGWISVLGVHPDWRRRGLGLALLRESFARFRASGETTVALGVDAANPTGATRLYERAGMHVLWQADVWEKELAAA
ncbi:MAG: GNAT family N-acetyltransferase [Gaiella sp.]